MRRAINPYGDALNDERQPEQPAPNENAHEETHDSRHKSDESFGRRLLEAHDNVVDDVDAAAKNANDVENLHDAANELLLEREVNQTRKEVLIVGHVASWQDFNDEQGFTLGTAFR